MARLGECGDRWGKLPGAGAYGFCRQISNRPIGPSGVRSACVVRSGVPIRPLILALAVLSGEPGEVDMKEVGRIYSEGQGHLEQHEYDLAISSFESLMSMLPEVEENKAIRESLILNILDASRDALGNLRNKDGTRKPEFIDRGLEGLKAYETAYEAAYGVPSQNAEISDVVQRLRDDVDEAAHEEPYIGPCLSPLPPCLSPPVIESKRGCGGKTGGVASLMLLPFALRRRRKSIPEQVSEALPADVVARLRKRHDSED